VLALFAPMGRGGRAKLPVIDDEVVAIQEYYNAMGLAGSHGDIRKLLRRYSFEDVCEAASVKYGKDPRSMLLAFGSAAGFSSTGLFDRARITRSAGGSAFSMRRVDGDAELLLYARKTGVSTFRIFLRPVDDSAATKHHSSYVGKLVANLAGTECVLKDCRSTARGEARQAAKVLFRRPESAGGTRRVLVSLASAPTLSLGSRTAKIVNGQHALVFRDLPPAFRRQKGDFKTNEDVIIEPVLSTKNMVLSKDGGTDQSSSAPFEFCKIGEDQFFCRFEQPLSAFEAFGLSLAAVHRKW